MMGMFQQAGAYALQLHEREREPKKDRLSQRAAGRYITEQGYDSSMLRKWTDAGLLTPVRSGDAPNSPLLYSKADIMAVIASEKLRRIAMDDITNRNRS